MADDQNPNSTDEPLYGAQTASQAEAPLSRRQLREMALAAEAEQARAAADSKSPMVSEEVSSATAALATFSKQDKQSELTRKLKRELRWAFVLDRFKPSRSIAAAAASGQAKPIQLKPRFGQRVLRAGATGVMVTALIATVAIPAYGALTQQDNVAEQELDDSYFGVQALTVGGEVHDTDLERTSYGATTSEEVAEIRAKEERARIASRMSSSGGSYQLTAADLALVAPGSGSVRWPVSSFSANPSINYFRTSTRPSHNGFDMMAKEGTPIYAVADGVVEISSEGYYGFGVAIVISHQIGGKSVKTSYGHMSYGTRAVSAGDRVSAGQFIGKVGNTGNSNGAHLHLEVRVNGTLVDPRLWLNANAG